MTKSEIMIWRAARELLGMDLYESDERLRREFSGRTVFDNDMTTVRTGAEMVFVTWMDDGRERRLTFTWPQFLKEVRRIGNENAQQLSEAEV